MKKIGQGLQFTVYDLENGNVMKVRNTKLKSIIKLVSWEPHYIFHPINLNQEVEKAFERLDESIAGLGKKEIESWMLANIVFGNGGRVGQERVTPLSQVFKKGNLEESKKLIDLYIDFVIHLWGYGICDITFNYTGNNGIDSSGRVVLMDIGELTFSKGKVRSYIRDRTWEKRWSFTKDTPSNLKEYVRSQMSGYLTEEVLENCWKE